MRSRGRLAALVAEAEAEVLRPRFVRVVAELLVHDRRPEVDGVRCPCCNSPDAEIVERRQVEDLVIDTRDGRRIRAGDVTPAEWAEYCELAERFDVPLRCSVHALPLLLDDTERHLCIGGGNRSGKTVTGLVWFALQWLRHGGKQRRLWLVASTSEKAYRLRAKLFYGTGEAPAVLPAGLILRGPDSHRASDLETTLVDGSVIDLRGFTNDPGAERLKSDSIVAGLVDEAAHMSTPDSLVALRGRCLETGGRLWLASTPRPSSFLKADVVDKAQEFTRLPADDPRKLSGAHEGAAWVVAALPIDSNPWVPLAHIEATMKTLDMGKAEAQRDFAGAWVASEGLYWEDKFDEERHTFSHDERDFGEWSAMFLASVGAGGHVPITGKVRARLCSNPARNPHHATIAATNNKWLIGQDVNFRMESVIVQVSAPADMRDEPDAWHFWIQDCVTSTRSNTDAHAARLVSVELSKTFDPRGSTRTLDGALVIMDATAITAVDPHQRRHGLVGSAVDVFARHNLEVRAPLYRRSDGKWKKAIPERAATFRVLRRLLDENRLHVASRCGPLLEAFATQLSEPNGQCPLDARRGKWDERMGPVDALRYLVYAAVNARSTAAVEWSDLPVATA